MKRYYFTTPFIFDGNWELVDGATRCYMVKKSGVSAVAVVMVDRKFNHTLFDGGPIHRPRNLKHFEL